MKKYIFLSAALFLFTASCSNDDNSNEQKEPTQAVQFSFTNEEFGEDETLTRSAETAKPQIVDLGDCEAEITVESEPAAKTRGAKTPANGHYTIRAYQAGTLKGEMKGTFSAGTFTPDASSPKDIVIPAGTYDFIAFNDDVIPSGTNLTTTRDKAETARMGFATQVITATPHKQTVNFTMKHIGCRLRTQFVCQKHIPNAITATLEQTAANVIPTSVSYDPVTKAYTSVGGAMTPKQNNSLASTEDKYWGSNYGSIYAYTSTSDYHYFLPTTEGSKLKLTGIDAGTVFWKPIPAFNIPNLNATLQMQAGKSYCVKIKLKPQYTYLMSDGTTGKFKDTTVGGGSKTPVAVVADPTVHVAIALKNVSDVTKYEWYSATPYSNNTTMYSTVEAGFADMEGYKWTWEAAGTTDGTIKANQQTTYPAFYAAGHYDPGVTVSGTLAGKKWYLAGWGEWYTYGAKNLGFAEDTNLNLFYGVMVNEIFTKVGGTKLTSSDVMYLPSTQAITGAPHFTPSMFKFEFSHIGVSSWYGSSGMSGVVRPFIKY
nr:hypothetical protein [Hoylesella enoeca]